ncbi:MAG: potassium transporter TrkG, partial [Oscillospiraceae bacterium]
MYCSFAPIKKVDIKSKNNNWMPARVITLSFLAVIAVGTILLMLPISAKQGLVTPFTDALFTATSATCVTGLVTLDTATHWSIFGQCVILLLIQIGGLGLVTLVSFFNIMMKKRIGLRSLQLARESISTNDFGDVSTLLRFIVAFSLTVEAAGALLLSLTLVPKYGGKGFFFSIFLSISSFCNAGFDPFGFETPFWSLTGFYSNPFFLSIIMLLIIIGGTGFGVWSNILSFPKERHLSLHTKTVLITTVFLIFGGA